MSPCRHRLAVRVYTPFVPTDASSGALVVRGILPLCKFAQSLLIRSILPLHPLPSPPPSRPRLRLLVITPFVLPSYLFLCTRVYTVVYPRVHCCIHACTQRRSLRLRLGALLNSINGLFSALQLAFSQLLLYSPINNVPACEAGGNLRCDLELWGEMHYLCRRKSKRGCA